KSAVLSVFDAGRDQPVVAVVARHLRRTLARVWLVCSALFDTDRRQCMRTWRRSSYQLRPRGRVFINVDLFEVWARTGHQLHFLLQIFDAGEVVVSSDSVREHGYLAHRIFIMIPGYYRAGPNRMQVG